MAKYRPFVVLFLGALFLTLGCQRKTRTEDAAVWKKVRVNFSRLDENGLAGPMNGKVSVHYEFCIPASDKYWKAVKKIDPTAELQQGSRGRSGCGADTWLVLGTTHQKNYRRVLYDLASLPYVKEIQETFFE